MTGGMQTILIGAFIVCVVGAFFSQAVLLWALLRGEKATVQAPAAGRWILMFFGGAVVLYMLLVLTAPKQPAQEAGQSPVVEAGSGAVSSAESTEESDV